MEFFWMKEKSIFIFNASLKATAKEFFMLHNNSRKFFAVWVQAQALPAVLYK